MARYDENFEEYNEEYAEQLDGEWRRELEKSEVGLARDIEKIESPDIRKREIQAARDIIKMKEDLNDRLSSGEIAKEDYEKEHEEKLMSNKRSAITRSFI